MTQKSRLAFLILSLLGLATSVYLTVTHFQQELLVCSENSLVDCGTVTSSEQSELFGVPVAVLGALFFAFLTAISLPWAWRVPPLRWVRLGAVGVGVLLVVYLVAAEFLLIGKVCLWCTVVHVVTLAQAGVLVRGELKQG
ncbi:MULTISPECIES: vitamin K epoxide reductase family protein [Actinosynnema]|uniref:Vitamin K epoxide reductase n=1 Tax=Actinosynnema pretiosum TaxID=42197 RepID=A0A290ZD76_9PSEU|nr:vitamin K epoxide reductase family protein [Actinosynnema pretiosum]ATE56934.1 Vitamin K epoxide reductase [Actinosynnema pretiosum]